ncbi:MAG: type II secretion system minor pseudopilin GspH [Gammaproteobacteria bacterium]|nr:type II secretion system minor pseudopilin GspH [Gammaproteobacteria bacterium]MCW8841733.1 type II secretion system minor pseudopilin GspH [Gammaproteobacteria bacterium]MCW8958245.1 type II secretion system minor pseudopilin GspH [Gammaproteobacteria bacterium]MCW8973549.1 type II secretion system minor pseudopilin GspH [Gammaproteobacteria bacterium]MCW8993646.1 type II secretion system minor pseudopilin GspH [Gammaproteobacteria bacterium]
MAPFLNSFQGERQRGFTLLELLVVLVLMGVIITITVLSIGDGGRGDQIREEARRLTALMELAAEEAVLNSSPYGLQLRREGYRFLHHRNGQWQMLEGDELLGEREWPAGVEVRLYLEGHQVSLEMEDESEEGGPTPTLILYPDGERTPFELELAYLQPPYLRQRISGVPFGPLELESLQER